MRTSTLTVPEVMDINSGKIYRAEDILFKDDSLNHIQRMEDETAKLRNKDSRYHCPICAEPLSIRGRVNQSYHFMHPKNPLAECPYRYSHSLTPDQINAMKYDGAKESQQHKSLKYMIQKSLIADKAIKPETVHSEKRINDQSKDGDWTKWRQPDVQAIFNDQLFVFEIQLSTTFLSVIAGRREFYLKNSAMLIWIFDEDILGEEQMRFTERDIFYNYNRNLFYVTAQTVTNSIALGECRLMCRYEEPMIDGYDIISTFTEKEISLSELTLEPHNQRVFYFNYDQHFSKLANQIDDELSDDVSIDDQEPDTNNPVSLIDAYREKQEREYAEYSENLLCRYRMPKASLNTQENFVTNWIRACNEVAHERALLVIWDYYYPAISGTCIDLEKKLPIEYRNIICALISLRDGTVYGTNLQNLRALENHIFSHYRSFYRHFAFGIRAYCREDDLKSMEAGSTCFKHLQNYKANKGHPSYIQNRKIDNLVKFLFPEIAEKSLAFYAKN
jgi:competence CoiA-like predicted nuclease